MISFGAAPHKPRLPDDEVRRRYPRYRWRVLEATFLGYAMYYLVRNNLAVVTKDMEHAVGYLRDNPNADNMLGNILAITAISYGIGKFLMGAVSDRSNARTFISLGLLLTAICNFAFGMVEIYEVHLALWAVNGFFQGMGWPPCGRSMGHWYSEKERGLTFSIWNTSHNVGGGIAGLVAAWSVKYFGGWEYAFFVPGVLAAIGAIYLFFRLVDTPQSEGLPPIEEYKGDFSGKESHDHELERELSYRELFLKYVLFNKYVWILAIANLFAYISRYSMLDWGPKYLREVKGATITGGGFAVFVLNFGGIPTTILLGYISDKMGGRRGMIATLCMIPVLLAFLTIKYTPPGYLWLDMAMLALISLGVYPVINLIVIMALDVTSKKAIGTAAGFIGLLGYLGRTLEAKGFGWMLSHFKQTHTVAEAWDMVFWVIMAASLIALVCLAFTWNYRPRGAMAALQAKVDKHQ
jgi:MFS transporter, OPA family, glycerol-3-phosphate transporter